MVKFKHQYVAVSFIGGVLRKKPLTCHNSDEIYYIVLYQGHLTMSGIQTHNFSREKHCLHGCKSNYHTTTTTTALSVNRYSVCMTISPIPKGQDK